MEDPLGLEPSGEYLVDAGSQELREPDVCPEAAAQALELEHDTKQHRKVGG
jgi:hypothetical protein